MKAILSLQDNNNAARAWLKQSNINPLLKNLLKKAVHIPWVAKINKDGKLEFLRGQVDYSTANTIGTIGVMYRFILESGYTYIGCTYPDKGKKVAKYEVTKEGNIIEI